MSQNPTTPFGFICAYLGLADNAAAAETFGVSNSTIARWMTTEGPHCAPRPIWERAARLIRIQHRTSSIFAAAYDAVQSISLAPDMEEANRLRRLFIERGPDVDLDLDELTDLHDATMSAARMCEGDEGIGAWTAPYTVVGALQRICCLSLGSLGDVMKMGDGQSVRMVRRGHYHPDFASMERLMFSAEARWFVAGECLLDVAFEDEATIAEQDDPLPVALAFVIQTMSADHGRGRALAGEGLDMLYESFPHWFRPTCTPLAAVA